MAVNNSIAMTLAIALVAFTGIGALLVVQVDAAPISEEAPEVDAAEPAPPQPMVASFVPLADVPRPVIPKTAITYPDGSSLPALNGVTVPIKLIWPSGRPYSPIIGKRVEGAPDFLEWYVHADGSHSTTAMMQVRRGGPKEATGMVRSPVPVAPNLLLPPAKDKDRDR